MNRYWNHFKTITKHKWYVFKLMCRVGRPIQGLLHDMSKYSYIEFIESAKYWSGTRSPIDNAKDVNGYALAWQNHKAKNKHHPEYWLDDLGEKQLPTPLLMPKKYAIEMVCDWIGAGMAYEKDEWTKLTPINWYIKVGKQRNIHPAIHSFCETVLTHIVICGLESIDKEFIEEAYDIATKE